MAKQKGGREVLNADDVVNVKQGDVAALLKKKALADEAAAKAAASAEPAMVAAADGVFASDAEYMVAQAGGGAAAGGSSGLSTGALLGIGAAAIVGGVLIGNAISDDDNSPAASPTPTPTPGNGPTPTPTPTAKTITLTTGADAPGAGAPAADTTGTSLNDTYNGFIGGGFPNPSTLTGADIIDGGAGTDTLNVTITTAAANLNTPDIKNVEVFNIRNLAGGSTLNADTFVGLETIIVDRATGGLTINDLSDTQKVVINGDTVTTVGNVLIQDGGLGGAAEVSDLTLKGGLQTATGGAGVVVISAGNGNGIKTATVTSSGAANEIATLAYADNALTQLNIKADSNFAITTGGQISGFSGVAPSTLTVTGAGDVTVNALDGNLDVYNASAATGAQTLTVGGPTQVITLGSGNDRVTTAGLVTTGTIDAGTGTDRLIVAATGHITAASGAQYKNFDVLQVNNGVAVDLDNLKTTNTITALRISESGTATSATNLTAAQAAAVSILRADGGAALTLGLAGASNAGQIDTVKAAVTTTTAAGAAQPINLATNPIVLAGVEKLELTGNGTVKATTGAITLDTTNATSLDSIKLTNAGDGNSVVVAAGHQAINLVIDASGSSGNTTLDASVYNTTTGATLKGGSGADVLLGSAQVDALSGGAGRDHFDLGTAVTAFGATFKVDTISDFGLVSQITSGATTTPTLAAFQASTVGGAGADALDLGGATRVTQTVVGQNVNVAAAEATANPAYVINASINERGVLTLSGADASKIDTLQEFVKAASIAVNDANVTAGTSVVFQFQGNSYVFVEGGDGALATAADTVVQLTGVAATGLSQLDGLDFARVGEVFIA